jgi:hypothetical protein
MTFRAQHVSCVSFAVEVSRSGVNQVLIIETDLHLNPRHKFYDRSAVEHLISAAQNYARANLEDSVAIRLISTRSGEI